MVIITTHKHISIITYNKACTSNPSGWSSTQFGYDDHTFDHFLHMYKLYTCNISLHLLTASVGLRFEPLTQYMFSSHISGCSHLAGLFKLCLNKNCSDSSKQPQHNCYDIWCNHSMTFSVVRAFMLRSS
ncbi:unnamed protein product [Lupinus luteus]|uniref:Uncharacterized protein n=1 Tax=Lupinus luteus TaxID=3873 RepID=A0AAV1WCN2_LUPLU